MSRCIWICVLLVVIYAGTGTDGQLLPPDMSTPICFFCTDVTTESTTTVNPYYECSSHEYYVQGFCKNYTDDSCTNTQLITEAVAACNYTEPDIFYRFILFEFTEFLCNYYLSLDTCVRKWVQARHTVCSPDELKYQLNEYIESIPKSLGMPPFRIYYYETCQVYSAGFTLRVIDANWTSPYTDTSSEYFWTTRDQHDSLVSGLSMSAFPSLYRDVVVTNIRQGSVLIDVTVFWAENSSLTVTNITDMLNQGLSSNSTYSLTYDVMSVNLTTGRTCVLGGIEYITGETFRTDDLCNRCVCNDGSLYCTTMNCSAGVWLDEYCTATTECGTTNSVCTNNTCICQEHFFPKLDNYTMICGQKGLNETCSSSQDCEGARIVCHEGYCSCLLGCFDDIEGCIECPADDTESNVLTILIVVFSVLAVFIAGVLLVVCLQKLLINKKIGAKGRQPKRLRESDLDPIDALPTALHVKPYLSNTFYKARLAKPYLMGDFSNIGESDDATGEITDSRTGEITDSRTGEITNGRTGEIANDKSREITYNEDGDQSFSEKGDFANADENNFEKFAERNYIMFSNKELTRVEEV